MVETSHAAMDGVAAVAATPRAVAKKIYFIYNFLLVCEAGRAPRATVRMLPMIAWGDRVLESSRPNALRDTVLPCGNCTMTSDDYHKDQIANRRLHPETLMMGYGYAPG